MTATAPTCASVRPASRGFRRKHLLMLLLAAEVLVFGVRGAERYRPPGIAVEQTVTHGNVIT